MKVVNVTVRQIENFRMSVDDGRHCICLDLPPELGTDKGPSALDLTVMSLAGCIAQIFTLVSKKMRVELDDLQVAMRAEQPDGAPTITKVNCELTVKSQENEEKLSKVWKHTYSTCPVGRLFEAAGVKIECGLKVKQQE